MNWETIKGWLRIGKEIGFRLLREDCRHCNGTGMCHSGRSEVYGISCASCQKAALGEVHTHVVKCEPCSGRGIFVFALPHGKELERATLELLPSIGEQFSVIRVTLLDKKASSTDALTESHRHKLLTDGNDDK